ncbi:TPA: putative holin-like toxin [Staphylococcus aureus]|nr:putative holin-like toxin [Staphylococcus aureus]HDA7139299.1 putative holin-like toxin [Staphylococcus aureus]
MLSFGMFIVTFIGIVVAIINLNNIKQPSFQNFDNE